MPLIPGCEPWGGGVIVHLLGGLNKPCEVLPSGAECRVSRVQRLLTLLQLGLQAPVLHEEAHQVGGFDWIMFESCLRT